ncbi:MAG: nucleoside hydrolase, partial [Clostridiales bacterium]|nr:nucleoside hydrolase [Clostridiales bacterium]
IMLILLSAQLLAGGMVDNSCAKKIIYETDMCADVDDVGGLAILHALENNGEAEILAVCFNEVHSYGAAAIDAINTWYGRGNIPVGIYKGQLDHPHGSGYLEHVAEFPHDLESSDAPSALDVYRQVLAEQPDSSVTIVSVGFMNNIDDLLTAEPDLVAQKVKELVQMAGVYNDGFNLVQHNLVSVSENVIRNWPTTLVISQEGGSIYTGDNLQNAPEENPVREAFYRYFGNEFNSRSSWDEMAVLYGVRGLSSYFNEITSGTGSLSNGYIWQMEPGFRSYLSNRLSNPSYVRIIEELMNQLPIGAHFNISEKSGWLPFSIEFDASISNVVGNRSIQQYLWDFGDETYGEGEMVTHEYTTVGNFIVELTIVDNQGDSLQTTDLIHVCDPIFSLIDYFGNTTNYEINQAELWSTIIDSNDIRLYLNNEPRSNDISLPGLCFIKDSIYSDFTLNMTVRTGEDLSQNNLADYSIIFGYKDEKNYNQLLMKYNSSRIVNVSNGQSIYIDGTGKDGIPDDRYHEVFLNLSGDQLTVTLDDTVFLTASSARLKNTGKIGFGSTKYSVFFDDIQILRNVTSVGMDLPKTLSSQIKLRQNYPNPFNPTTTIQFDLPKKSSVTLTIFNIIGRNVRTIVRGKRAAGTYEIVWNGLDDNGLRLPSGVYFAQLQVGDIVKTIKLNLIC